MVPNIPPCPHTHAPTRLYMYNMYIYLCLYIYICVYIDIHHLNVYMYIHIYTHIHTHCMPPRNVPKGLAWPQSEDHRVAGPSWSDEKSVPFCYPLVNVYSCYVSLTMGKSPFLMDKLTINGPFSIANCNKLPEGNHMHPHDSPISIVIIFSEFSKNPNFLNLFLS